MYHLLGVRGPVTAFGNLTPRSYSRSRRDKAVTGPRTPRRRPLKSELPKGCRTLSLISIKTCFRPERQRFEMETAVEDLPPFPVSVLRYSFLSSLPRCAERNSGESLVCRQNTNLATICNIRGSLAPLTVPKPFLFAI